MNEFMPKEKILIVDDAPWETQILGKALINDYQVLTADDGAMAIELASSDDPPDLILLDIMMPEMDGYEVCRYLKSNEKTRDIPIIFISAKDAEQDETDGLKLGAVDYITKPISMAIVQARVNTHLRVKKAEEEKVKRGKLQGVLEMAGAAAHEFSQPLQVIVGNLDLLLMKAEKDNPDREIIDNIKQASSQLQKVVHKIQKITKYETETYVKGVKIVDIDKAST